MDKLSEYLPLLIIVGSIIYSVVRGSSRKKAEDLSKTTLPGHTDGKEIYFPETSEQDIFFPEIIEQVVPPVRKEQKKSKVNMAPPPVYQQTTNDPPKKTLPSEPEEPETEWIKLENIDEVKKAIIYAEIFSRKEY